MKKLFLIICLPIVIFSCKNNSEERKPKTEIATKRFEKIERLQWLVGTWINDAGEEFSQETWARENDSTFTAYSFTQVGNETVFAETIALEQIGNDLLFTAVAANQNDEKPITFRLVSAENGEFVFENKSHDFPERIIYTNPAKDSLHAWIEGTANGKPKRADFYFSKKE